jgi:hypothetical protein
MKKYKYKKKTDEPDYWELKFGDAKTAYCEICLTKKLVKNKSCIGYTYDDNDEMKLECQDCFEKDMGWDVEMTKEEYEEEQDKERNTPFVDINDMYECLRKAPYAYRVRDYIYGNKRKGKCALCEDVLKLREDPGAPWYKMLPSEGGDLSLDNYDLLCDDCYMYAFEEKKEGIDKIRKEFKN